MFEMPRLLMLLLVCFGSTASRPRELAHDKAVQESLLSDMREIAGRLPQHKVPRDVREALVKGSASYSRGDHRQRLQTMLTRLAGGSLSRYCVCVCVCVCMCVCVCVCVCVYEGGHAAMLRLYHCIIRLYISPYIPGEVEGGGMNCL